jgi:hypothetical protein
MKQNPSVAGRALLALLVGAVLLLFTPAQGQSEQTQPPTETPGPFETNLRPAEDQAEIAAKYHTHQKLRSEMERELRKLRAEYFRNIRNPQIRQAGIIKLRQYIDPVIFPSLIEIFAREDEDVRGAILDHLVDQQHDDADTVVAWIAVFDKDKNYREMAAERLQHRMVAAAGPTPRIKAVIMEGLTRSRDQDVASAAQLASMLQIAEVIPMLINAQAVARSSGSGGRESSLAWILVGQQQAYVSGLTPVVGPNSVAFDPQLSVITTGTVLRVIDAVVVTYRVEVHSALVNLTSNLWGQSTAHMGYDGSAWSAWYTREFLPYWTEKQASDRAATPRQAAPASPAPPSQEPGEPSASPDPTGTEAPAAGPG